MKKLTVLAAFIGAFSTAALAAPVGETFTGWGTGLELTSTKFKGGKQATSGAVVVDYGINQDDKFVGIVGGKLKLHNSKIAQEDGYTLQDKGNLAVSYAQGYRVTPDFLPYLKASYQFARYNSEYRATGVEVSESGIKSGLGYGAGVKYAVSSNFELGAEYQRTNVKYSDLHKNANNFSANAGYRF